jgi:hypothetical protein
VKRNPKGAKTRRQTLRVWTYEQARAAVPYFRSIIRSVREHAQETLAWRRQVDQINNRPGRPDRTALISLQQANEQARRAEDRFDEAVEELQGLDVYSLEPLQGLALVPFVHNEQLAWYIFDLFDAQPFRFWRFQSDPDDTRRPITSMQHGNSETTQTV